MPNCAVAYMPNLSVDEPRSRLIPIHFASCCYPNHGAGGNHSTLWRWLLPDWNGERPPRARIAKAAATRAFPIRWLPAWAPYHTSTTCWPLHACCTRSTTPRGRVRRRRDTLRRAFGAWPRDRPGGRTSEAGHRTAASTPAFGPAGKCCPPPFLGPSDEAKRRCATPPRTERFRPPRITPTEMCPPPFPLTFCTRCPPPGHTSGPQPAPRVLRRDTAMLLTSRTLFELATP